MRSRFKTAAIFLFACFLVTLMGACGKKKPPFIPKTRFPFYVQLLKAYVKDNTVFLKGYLVGPQGSPGPLHPPVLGCRVYMASFGPDLHPCEGCPIELRSSVDIKGVVKDGRFECSIPDISERGTYFFQVRLIGPDHALGPPSDRVKLVLEKDLD